MDFLRKLFSSGDFMPHGYCNLWQPALIWLHVVSDTLIALAYFSIPLTLIYFIRKRRDVPFNWVFVCFGIFILACGATHAMEVWAPWHAIYWLSGAVKGVTASASVPTAILLVGLIPKALAIPEIIGESGALKRVLSQVETVAATDSTVLVLGETGTGKDLVARAIHNLSARRDRNFVNANCAAIPAGLLESELFGHERGAFTGAVAREIGRFEMADKGSMFLDEVGDIPLELQSKLLRVVQEQEFQRLGAARTIRVNFRLVAATNRDLLEMVETGGFRRDLYYRLNVFPITVPPLRDRLEDIPLLVSHFAKTYAERMNKTIDRVRPKDMEALVQYSWPGNVRELQNVIERCVILSSDRVLHAPEFPDAKRVGKEASSKPRSLAEAEREHILQALRDTEWVIGGPHGAAAQLAVRRTTLLYKMRRLGISRPAVDGSLSAG